MMHNPTFDHMETLNIQIVEELPLEQIGDVYLLDFVGPPVFVQQLSPKVDRVIILDHHKTALKMIDDGDFDYSNVTKVIDMGSSGATIAYDFFMEKILSLENVNNSSGCELGIRKFECSRKLFEYIEDADMWRWRLQNSKAFNSCLKDMNLEFNVRLNPSLFHQIGGDTNEYMDADIDDIREEWAICVKFHF